MNPTLTPPWQSLANHAKDISRRHLRDLFASDADRFKRFSLVQDGLLVDFSKQRIDGAALEMLHDLANAVDLPGWKSRMLAGEKINHTEDRAVRHMALRGWPDEPPEVAAVLARMRDFCGQIHDGIWRGYSGDRITDIVNLGVGGSDLGPRMVVKALAAQAQPDLSVHFVANIDGADIASLLATLNPRSTLFIVASKTFTTLETLQNAQTARDWLLAAANEQAAIARHFVAVSTHLDRTDAFGIPRDNVFEFWDWVGGRFSLWSAIGLSVALAVGWPQFRALLAGAASMDQHFMQAPAHENLPLTLALLALWNTNFLDAGTTAVLPYSQSLALLPAYLQQLEMESNGKQVDRQGKPINYRTAPVLFGEAGTNGQHSFYQLFHQGGRLLPCDFIAVRDPDFPLSGHHTPLLANCLAQSAALAFGQTAEEVAAAGVPAVLAPYKEFPGNQPSSTIVLPALNAHNLGQLLSLYEHKVFCLGILWNINSFDQWGVELGKQLAGKLTTVLEGTGSPENFDASTRGLIAALRKR